MSLHMEVATERKRPTGTEQFVLFFFQRSASSIITNLNYATQRQGSQPMGSLLNMQLYCDICALVISVILFIL